MDVWCLFFCFFYWICSLAQKRVRETKKNLLRQKRYKHGRQQQRWRRRWHDFPSFSIASACVYVYLCVFLCVCVFFAYMFICIALLLLVSFDFWLPCKNKSTSKISISQLSEIHFNKITKNKIEQTKNLLEVPSSSTKRKKKMVGNENRSFILLHSVDWFSLSKMDGMVQKQTKSK